MLESGPGTEGGIDPLSTSVSLRIQVSAPHRGRGRLTGAVK